MTIDIERLTTAVGTEFVKALSDTLTSATAVKSVLKEMADESSANFRRMGSEVRNSNEALGRSAKHVEAMGFSFKEMAKAVAGPASIAGAFVALTKVVNDFAVASTRMTNFARDTGIAEDTISKMQRASSRLGYTAGETNTFIGNLSATMQDLRFHTDLTGTAVLAAVESMGQNAVDRMAIFQRMMKEDVPKALQWLSKSIEKETPEIQRRYWAAIGIPQSWAEKIIKEMEKVAAAFKPPEQILKDWNELYGSLWDAAEDKFNRIKAGAIETALAVAKAAKDVVQTQEKHAAEGGGVAEAQKQTQEAIDAQGGRSEDIADVKSGRLKAIPPINYGPLKSILKYLDVRKEMKELLFGGPAMGAEGGAPFDWGRMDMEGGGTERSRELLKKYPKSGTSDFEQQMPNTDWLRGAEKYENKYKASDLFPDDAGHPFRAAQRFGSGMLDFYTKTRQPLGYSLMSAMLPMQIGALPPMIKQDQAGGNVIRDRLRNFFGLNEEAQAKELITNAVESGVIKGLQSSATGGGGMLGAGGGGFAYPSSEGPGGAGARVGGIRRGGQSPMARNLISAVGANIKEVGGTSGQWDTYRQYMAGRESGGRYTAVNQYGYAGAYQFGSEEIRRTATQLGETPPSREQFLSDPKMQERYMDAYTAAHHRNLMASSSEYRAMSAENRFAVLGYAHLLGEGWGTAKRPGALQYLKTGRGGADANNTSGTSYMSGLRQRLREARSTGAGADDERSRVNSGLGMYPPNWHMGGADVNVNFNNTPPGTKVNGSTRGVFNKLRLEQSPQGGTVGAGVGGYDVNAPD